MQNQVKSWLLSKQDYLPALILLNKDFGIYEPVFANSCKKYWPNLSLYQRKMPSIDTINAHIAAKERVIITSPSLESLFKWSDLGNVTPDEFELLASKLLVIENADVWKSEDDCILKIFNLMNDYKDDEFECQAYSENLLDYFNTFKSPEYFINNLFERFEDQKDWPVVNKKEQNYINLNLLKNKWHELFESSCPFSELELKRWVWERSKAYNFQTYIHGPKYRKFTKWNPYLDKN